MLQKLTAEIRLCYWRADEYARRARAARAEPVRTEYVHREQRWLRLARSYELQQRLALMIDENSKCKAARDPGIGQVNFDGPAPKMPGAGRWGNEPEHLQTELIAVVDDDGYARAGLCALIESLGHSAAMFASAEDYLASGTNESTACLFLDVHLPGMSGPDLQAYLIAAERCPPIIFATGRFEQHVRDRVLEAGALAYLTKPCSEKALLDCIGRVLAQRQPCRHALAILE